MRKLLKAVGATVAAASVFGASLEAQAFSVGGYSDAEELVNALLVPGWSPVPGTISVTESAGLGNGSIGFFNDGGSTIGINSGVILTSGLISLAPGPNNTSSATGPGTLSSISFDFVAVSPGISWNYVFASEEYEEYVGSGFNDFFRLELNGTNLALIPGTSEQVRINNVNQNLNTPFYVSNFPPAGTNSPFNIQYDGFTIPLTAQATGLTLGETYNVNFVVSDVGDAAWDSAVMIAANSISFPGATPENPLLPVPPASPNETWIFPTFTVFDPGFVWWIDPDIATGYVYNATGGPLFDQFTAPDLAFNDNYQLFSSSLPGGACSTNGDDFTTPMANISQLVPYDFTTPLSCFAIKGIDIQNALDPLNTNAFAAGVSFDVTGNVNVTQTPITTFVDPSTQVPGPLPILGAGAGYGWARRLRKRLRKIA